MLSEHISGLARSGAARRSSSVIPWPPPVVMLTTAPVDCLIRGRNCINTSGSGVGRPCLGGGDRVARDLVGCQRQVWAHRRGMDRPRDGAGYDDLATKRHPPPL